MSRGKVTLKQVAPWQGQADRCSVTSFPGGQREKGDLLARKVTLSCQHNQLSSRLLAAGALAQDCAPSGLRDLVWENCQ